MIDTGSCGFCFMMKRDRDYKTCYQMSYLHQCSIKTTDIREITTAVY